MATNEQRLKTITDNIEGMYQSLRRAAANISGLLQVGRATCDEVKAYNLWALATYNTQRGMLATLRANGEQGVPDLPQAPTLFTWRGVQGADAWKLDCSGEPSSLSGAMSRAMKGPAKTGSPYLSTQEIQITTSDQYLMDPTAAPSFKTLLQIQQARNQQQVAGLGVIGVLIVIAAIAVAVSVALVAIMHYLEVNEVQESNTEQVKLQADAFANYTAARLSCYASCTGQGKTTEECVEICAKLVDKPNIKLPGMDKPWGTLQWVGFTVVVGAASMIGWKLYQRRRAGKPLFELPDSVEDALAP